MVVWLDELQHDVASIQEESPGLDDPAVLRRAVAENRILITKDKDFGTLVFKEGQPHSGIILLRLADDNLSATIAAMRRLQEGYSQQLAGNFVVINDRRVRVLNPQGLRI